jgi:hypothetical protein
VAVVNKDTIMERLRENFNDNDSDDVLGLLEDVTDTLNDYQSRLEENGDWKERYEQNDREWRQKYKDRFFNNEPEPDLEPEPDKDPEQATPTTFEELFHFE